MVRCTRTLWLFLLQIYPAVDIWSIGCIFAEMLIGKPLFPGKNVVHQLDIMTDLLGTPSAEAISRICWYFSDTWEQFRINGRIEVIDAFNPEQAKLQQREKAWFANSLRSRLLYICPTPGSPYSSEQSNQEVKLDPSRA